MSSRDIYFIPKAKVLFQPKRYKIFYGGRGGGKSQNFGLALLVLGMQKKLQILCAREFQNSITDSVHKMLSVLIEENNLESFYKVQQTTITGKNGTEFIFHGLKHNISSIKSFEGVNYCWVEEGTAVSKHSWDVLIPTIRAKGSEIWISFNPELETDETYQRFVVHPPKDSVVVKLNYTDNPKFPYELEQERQACLLRDPDGYLNIWEGHCKQALEGAVYANELRDLTQNNHITKVPYNPRSLVHTFWDLGWGDTTAIWFVQKVGMEYHIIDYYENNLTKIPDYVRELNNKKYIYGIDWLPHDGENHSQQTGMTIKEQLENLGRKVKTVPKLSKKDGIAATRTIFELCWFDSEKCIDGLNALRHYRYDINTTTEELSREPKHDWASNGADALRYFAISTKKVKEKEREQTIKPVFFYQRHKTGFGRV